MKKLLLGFLLLSLSGLHAAPVEQFETWDKNDDGKLTKDELPKQLQRNFDHVDKDNDGFISLDEHKAVRSRLASRPANPQRAGRAEFEGVKVIRNIDYAGTGNPRHTLDLYLPEVRKGEEPLPLLVFIHGGGWRKGSKDGAGRRVTPFLKEGTLAGAAINYRLTDEAQWPSQIHDCKAALRWLRGNAEKYGFDKEKIAVWGTSAGGHLVAMLGVSGDVENLEGDIGDHDKESSRVQLVIDYFGPTEILTMGKGEVIDHTAADSPEGLLLGGAPEKKEKAAKSASPVTHVSKDDAPILIVHGTKDALVPYEQSVKFDKLLDAAGVESILIKVDGGGHGQGFNNEVLQQRIATFLDRHFFAAEVSVEEEVMKALPARR